MKYARILYMNFSTNITLSARPLFTYDISNSEVIEYCEDKLIIRNRTIKHPLEIYVRSTKPYFDLIPHSNHFDFVTFVDCVEW